MESNFSDLNIGAIGGTELMGLLGLSSFHLNDPILFNRVSDVVNHLKNEPDAAFFINRITAGKSVDRLTHVWSYIKTLEKKSSIQNQLTEAERKLQSFSDKESVGTLSEIEKSLASDFINKKNNLSEELLRTDAEKSLYER